ncbi:MAG TPA: hypothetical protein VFZ25_19985 [Chloroflexota bacterium]|nr:hypothetical protein [Chloroflexota bacterium]
MEKRVEAFEAQREWKNARKAFFERIARASAQSDLTPAAAESLVNEAIQQVRRRPKP